MAATLMQNGKSSFQDANGKPLVNGRVTFYQVGTNTLKDTWKDFGKTTLNTNPIILDARGEASIYGDGAYRQVLRDSAGNLIWDQVIPDLFAPINDAIALFSTTVSTQVTNIAALRALSKATYKNAQTRGYYADGDGGGGRYYLDATDVVTADNGGTVIVATDGGRWKLVYDGITSLYQWGAKGDKLTDDTTKVQAAVTWASAGSRALFVPSCAGFKLTAPITSGGSPRLLGEQIQISKTIGGNVNNPGTGSWFYIAHTGVGFKFNDAGLVVCRPIIEMIGTYRDQPVPAGGAYTPTAHDYDFYFFNCDSVVKNIALWNCTRGIYITATPETSQSRGDISGVYGCPMQLGIVVDFLADVIRIDNVHFWPYWTSSASAAAYQRASATGISLYRCDNPMITRYFTYGYRYSLYLGKNANGATGKLKMSIFDFDFVGERAIFIDGESISAIFTSGSGQGYSPTTTLNFLEISAGSTGCNIAVDNIDVGIFSQNALRCGGSVNNVLRVGDNVRIYQWNGAANGFPAIGCTANNFVELSTMPYFTAPLNSGVALDIEGNIRARLELPPANYSTDVSGKFAIPSGVGRVPVSIFPIIVNDSNALSIQQTTTPNVMLVSKVIDGTPQISSTVRAAAILVFV